MEEATEELTIYYNDDHGNIQGPYAATTVLGWYQKGFFSDEHVMRITDNGQRVGNKITFENTLGELKERFGIETPIPTSLNAFAFTGFDLRPQSNRRQLNVLKPMQKDSVASNKKALIHIKKENLDENSDLVAGPELPPVQIEKQNERRRRRSSSSDNTSDRELGSKKVSERVDRYGPELPPTRKTDKRPDSRSSSRKEESKNKKTISSSDRNLPFYDGDKNKDNTRLQKVIAIEFASILRQEYMKLEKIQRDELHNACTMWGLPNICKVCRCDLSMAANFLSHVLSAPHITKSIENRSRRFTYEGDYLIMKEAIEEAKNIPSSKFNVPKPQSLPPRKRSHTSKSSDPDVPYHVRERCSQS